MPTPIKVDVGQGGVRLNVSRSLDRRFFVVFSVPGDLIEQECIILRCQRSGGGQLGDTTGLESQRPYNEARRRLHTMNRRLVYFSFFDFSGFCAAHLSIIWKKTDASSG